MNRDRFALALKQLDPSDGVRFEQLASAFAVLEFGELRTIAAISGDGGRDAFLYTPIDDDRVALQYSVTKYTSEKITKTVKRLKQTNPDVRELIYVTCQE